MKMTDEEIKWTPLFPAGEPIFQEGMQLRHDAGAREAGVHVVSAVGYDSIPAEMGVRELHNAFPGERPGLISTSQSFH